MHPPSAHFLLASLKSQSVNFFAMAQLQPYWTNAAASRLLDAHECNLLAEELQALAHTPVDGKYEQLSQVWGLVSSNPSGFAI